MYLPPSVQLPPLKALERARQVLCDVDVLLVQNDSLDGVASSSGFHRGCLRLGHCTAMGVSNLRGHLAAE